MVEENLSSADISRNLKTDFIGQKVIAYPSLTSTNDIAKREAKKGAREGTVILAEEQTAGRGRLKRAWLSPRGSIALSIILHPTPTQLPSLIMLASLAVARCIEKVGGLETQIKWPNDVLINGKKVCGILIESDVRGSAVDYAVIGIGLNVNLKPADFPEIAATATSLSKELGHEVSRLKVLRSLLTFMEREYLLLAKGESPVTRWTARLLQIGEEVQVDTPWGRETGQLQGVDAHGALLVRQGDGTEARITVGDVS